MTFLITKDNALTLTLENKSFPVRIRTEIEDDEKGKIQKEYLLIKTKSGAIAVATVK